MNQTVMEARAARLLQELWEEMRNGANAARQSYALGYLNGFRDLGLVSDLEEEAWVARLKTCPGHEPCRVWCAYCGDIEPEANDERRSV